MPSQQFEMLAQAMKAQRTAVVAPVPQLRTNLEALADMAPPVEDVEATSSMIGSVPIDRVAHVDAVKDRLLLYLHGGGYCIGSRASHRHIVSRLTRDSGLPVYVPEYRLAPESPYPAGLEDVLLVYRRLVANGTPADHIVLAGESAGGGLTIALQLALKEAGEPLPAASAVMSPWADLTDLGPISDEAMDIDFLRPETLEMFAECYLSENDPAAYTISPGLADLSGLPPMLIQAGEAEILADTARRLAARAKDCGVDVTLEIEPGLFHAWHLFCGMIPEADESIARVGKFLRDRLSSR
jgi:monoterpene epsilon-lactone hydrolase